MAELTPSRAGLMHCRRLFRRNSLQELATTPSSMQRVPRNYFVPA